MATPKNIFRYIVFPPLSAAAISKLATHSSKSIFGYICSYTISSIYSYAFLRHFSLFVIASIIIIFRFSSLYVVHTVNVYLPCLCSLASLEFSTECESSKKKFLLYFSRITERLFYYIFKHFFAIIKL